MGKGPGNHPVMAPLVNTNGLSTWAKHLMFTDFSFKPLGNSILMASNNMTMTDFIVPPQLFLTRCTLNYEHI